MSACSDDAALIGTIALFVGIESANWSDSDWQKAIQFCKDHRIGGLIVKVSEVGSHAGDIWYGGIDGVKHVQSLITQAGLKFLAYGFLYGDEFGNLQKELDITVEMLNTFGAYCVDIESGNWSGSTAAGWAGTLNATLSQNPNKLYVSLPANPVDASQQATFQALSPSINVWMPMAYSAALDKEWHSQITGINPQACIIPTFDLSNEFGQNDPLTSVENMKNASGVGVTLWEYTFAVQNTGLVDAIVQAWNGSSNNVVQTNSAGCVLDIRQSYQLESGESEDLCGPWSIASLMYAGLPGKGPRGSAEDIDTWADSEVDKYQSQGHVNWQGSSVQDMYNFLTDATDPQGKQRNLHWWDMDTPSIDNVRRAVKAGYPVVVTVNEQNLIEKRTGKHPPYPWNLNANHIIPVLGIDKDGDFICCDELNNNFQGYWPPVYKAFTPVWATVVQVVGPDPNNPWLKSIPSGNPASWPQNFNAQNFGGSTPMPPAPPNNNFEQEAQDAWYAFFNQFVSLATNLSIPLPGGFDIKQFAPPTGTGIYNSWHDAWLKGHQFGPPLTFEYRSVNSSGKEIIVQQFAGARCEWDGAAHWYTSTGPITF